MILDNYENQFERLLEKRAFSNDFNHFKKDAFLKFKKLGFPTRRWEDWRFTNLKNIRRKSYSVPTYRDSSAIDLKFESYYRKGFIPIVFQNGHFIQPTKNNFKDLSINSDVNFTTLMKYNGLFPENENQPFELLNSAFMDSKMEITIKGNNYYEKPLHFIFIYDNKEELMISPRIYLNISSNSSATILEEHIGDSNSFLNYSKFIHIHRNAHLNHTKIHSNSKNRISITNLNVYQDSNSNYRFTQFSNGYELNRLNIKSHLKGQGSDCSLSGISLSKEGHHIDNNIIINHHSPNCMSSQNFRSILKDRSSGVYNGRTIVKSAAQKTNSSQSNKNILLSDTAKMNSNPQLEIYADDVKCSHGSTTGKLNKDAIFYLRSRGLDLKSARELLLNGFVNDIIEQVKNKDIKYMLNKNINIWLNE